MAIRKIDLMHREFGECEEHTCGECSNLVEHRYDKCYRKCVIYGCTNSEASDWAKRWIACGMFNKDWNGRPIIEMVKPTKEDQQQYEPLEGQISMIKEG